VQNIWDLTKSNVRNDRYTIEKLGEEESPQRTSMAADHMKMWSNFPEDPPDDENSNNDI